MTSDELERKGTRQHGATMAFYPPAVVLKAGLGLVWQSTMGLEDDIGSHIGDRGSSKRPMLACMRTEELEGTV